MEALCTKYGVTEYPDTDGEDDKAVSELYKEWRKAGKRDDVQLKTYASLLRVRQASEKALKELNTVEVAATLLQYVRSLEGLIGEDVLNEAQEAFMLKTL